MNKIEKTLVYRDRISKGSNGPGKRKPTSYKHFNSTKTKYEISIIFFFRIIVNEKYQTKHGTEKQNQLNNDIKQNQLNDDINLKPASA